MADSRKADHRGRHLSPGMETTRSARSADPTSIQPGGFSGLREDGHESHLIMQWGLVRTVVDTDGLPAKDRTSLAPLTP